MCPTSWDELPFAALTQLFFRISKIFVEVSWKPTQPAMEKLDAKKHFKWHATSDVICFTILQHQSLSILLINYEE